MSFDINHLESILHETARHFADLEEQVETDPKNALQSFQDKILNNVRKLEKFDLKANSASILRSEKNPKIQQAIQDILTASEKVQAKAQKSGTSKDAQEKAAALQAAIFGNESFKNYVHKLKDLSKFLKRGERVEPTEQGGV